MKKNPKSQIPNPNLGFILLFTIFVLTAASFGWVMTSEYEKEIAQKEAAMRANPASPDAKFDLAITYAYTNKIEAGLDALKKTADLAGGNVKGYSEQLIDRYYDLMKKNPKDWKIRFRLAFAYYFGGYKAYAIQELQNVANIQPGNAWPYGYMAVIYAEEGNWKQGIVSMKKAIAIDSNVAAFHLGLGQAYYKTGNSYGGFMETAEALRLKAIGY